MNRNLSKAVAFLWGGALALFVFVLIRLLVIYDPGLMQMNLDLLTYGIGLFFCVSALGGIFISSLTGRGIEGAVSFIPAFLAGGFLIRPEWAIVVVLGIVALAYLAKELLTYQSEKKNKQSLFSDSEPSEPA